MGFAMEKQKEAKKKNLLEAAYALFLLKGTGKTSVSDIVDRANVAKGTFYLYFRDKEELMQQLVYQISYEVLGQAYQCVKKRPAQSFADDVVVLVDAVIEYFKQNKAVLQLLRRNFCWPVFQDKLENDEDPLWRELRERLYQSKIMIDRSLNDVLKEVFIILEMCGAVCHEAIIENRPDTIDNMKPILFEIIRKILS
ncbi:MAG: TetR/AcrR family transcriptional regulator [Oscillospiraceae bacterium]|nr:TetR/AcrR family transcriptional regulator [Oscillospiraceae bacterium]